MKLIKIQISAEQLWLLINQLEAASEPKHRNAQEQALMEILYAAKPKGK